MNRAFAFGLLGIVCLGTVLATGEAAAFCRMTTDDPTQVGNARCSGEGEPLEWRDACVSFSIDQRGGALNLPAGDVENAIISAFETWESVDCGPGQEPPNVVFQQGPPSTCREAQFNGTRVPNVNTVAFLDPWETVDGEPLTRGALAVTVVSFFGDGQIVDFDMLINDTVPWEICPDFGCVAESDAEVVPFDLQNVVTHEAGHALGIGHPDPNEPSAPLSTMYFQAPPGEVIKRDLAADDIDAVCSIYPPGNLNNNCDATPFGGLDLNCEDEPPEPSGGGGCAAAPMSPKERKATGFTVLAALVALMAMRRRSRRLDGRS